LAEAGASVVIADLDGAGAGQASAALDEEGLSARPFPIDVADESKVKAVFEFATREFGCVDIVVNNAGIFPQATIREMSAKAFDRVIAVNLRGLYLCTKYGAEAIIEQGRGGKIINITSTRSTPRWSGWRTTTPPNTAPGGSRRTLHSSTRPTASRSTPSPPVASRPPASPQ
jgi:NAD(P)-dependent dehydrogenase (short-subunit alcohol dehydrogenase family)